MGLWNWLFGPPSRRRFAQQIMAGLKRAGYQYDIRYEPDEFRLVFLEEGQTRGFAQLHNIYHEHCQTPRAERRNHLRRLIRSKLRGDSDIPEEYEDARHDILPVIRSRAYFELTPLQARVEGLDFPSPPYQPLAEHLGIGLVFDLPESMVSLNQSQLDKWEVSYYEAHEASLENLREMPLKAYAQLGEGLYSFMSYDNYDASRILLPEVLEQLELDGAPLALIAHRDCVLVTGTNDTDSQKLMLQLAEKELENPRAISGVPICYEDDEWHDWLPPEGHPCHAQFKLLQLQTVGQHYAHQQELLNKEHAQNDNTLFVASFSAMRKAEAAPPISYCVWSQGVPSLLPETELIVLMGENGEQPLAQVPWSVAEEIVGSMLEPQEKYYPRRFRVLDFPNTEQIARLAEWRFPKRVED